METLVVDFNVIAGAIMDMLESAIPVVLPILGITIGVPLAVRLFRRLAR